MNEHENNLKKVLELDSVPKYIYEFGDITDEYLMDKIIGIQDAEIITGEGGFNILAEFGSRFLPFVKVEKEFDPLMADGNINPVLATGYRLSSYMFWIKNSEKSIKVIPRNPITNLSDLKY